MDVNFWIGLLTGSTLAFGICFGAVMVIAYRGVGRGGDKNEAA